LTVEVTVVGEFPVEDVAVEVDDVSVPVDV
jgi:hypothetical protein